MRGSLFANQLFFGVVLAVPKIRMIQFESSHLCSNEYLVEGLDSIFINYEVSGNDSIYLFDLFDGPKHYYTESNGKLNQPCNAFTSTTGDCIERNGPIARFCTCCCQTFNSIHTGFNITARTEISNGTVYLRWPGTVTDIFSKKYRFPEVRAKEGGYMREFIGIGVVVSLAFIASAAAVHYFHGKKASTAFVQSSSHAVNNLSSPISASRETQQEGQDDPGDTTNSGPTKVPSQTDASPANDISSDIH
ncbi:hypothetical protein RRG08_056969 [Elysia crispata]|uniref:Uncharacterized protein n=1 Tax=Elysia crispata TaxID=231223 RepID=A0AAE1DA05_9GAST|nr:hypothetical protein RRG08_056969 [Elysia crispata]